MEIITVKNLSFSYNGSAQNVLDNISFGIEKGSFNLVIGRSGCGKSTLLKCIKQITAPHGTRSGYILYNSKDVTQTDERTLVTDIGYVSQSPDAQIVTDLVSSELAFGLENTGLDAREIRSRTAEISYYFGIASWYNKEISVLSGGQKQLLNLAAVIAMRPEVLVLDEPTAQLDPVARENFIDTVRKLNKDLGMTVIICEHNLENVYSAADRVILMDQGKIICNDTPQAAANYMLKNDVTMKASLPSCTQLCHALFGDREIIMSNALAKEMISKLRPEILKPRQKEKIKAQKAFEIKKGYFRYLRNGRDILKNISLTGFRGEILALTGANASGKTTLLSVLCGSLRLYSGKVSVPDGRVVFMPQNPAGMFLKSSVREDIAYTARLHNKSKDDTYKLLESSDFYKDIFLSIDKNPMDLSGGEMQRLAFFKIMLTDPTIILMDEPTKGLDAKAKTALADILTGLRKKNICTVLVTHDLEFAAQCCDRCAMLFDGQIISCEEPSRFFCDNYYYTTQVNKLVKNIMPDAVTLREVMRRCRKEE
ncbi:MAG: ATP-binding cassette domain-containing protein [Oscillospiraceae bacterium]|nr:ATP-binding cassette domain-containing protein [Oscillospiraceae bacterium]